MLLRAPYLFSMLTILATTKLTSLSQNHGTLLDGELLVATSSKRRHSMTLCYSVLRRANFDLVETLTRVTYNM